MKAKLPIIGPVATGKDAQKRTYTKKAKPEAVEKITPTQLGAGFLDLGERALTGEKDISNRLIKSFYSWVFANVSVLSEEISKADFELYTTKYNQGELEFTPIDSHPVLDLLDQPNPFTTTSQLLYITQAHLELAGDCFWLLDNATNPKNIFVLQPDKVTVNPGDQSKGYLIESYVFKDTVDGKNVETTYPPELIIHHKVPNPDNPYRGKSVVEAASVSIDNSNLAREFLKMFFRNGAVPNFILGSEQRITDEDVKRIQAQLRSTYGGVMNAFKTMILGGGIKPVSVQQTGQQMQLLELLTAMRDEIMAMFKNTKASLGIVEDVNRANAESSLESWKQSVIKPKLTRITDTINEFLVPKFGDNIVLGFCDPVPENKMDDIEEVTKLMANTVRQVMTVNEARSILDLEPLPNPDFDTIQGPQPIVMPTPPTDNTPKSLRNISLKKHMRRMKWYGKANIEKDLYEAAKKVAEKQVKRERSKKVKEVAAPIAPKMNYANFNHEEALAYWQKQINHTDMAEKRFEERLLSFISQLEEKAIKNLHSIVPKASKRKAYDLFNETDEVQAAIDLLTPLAQEIAQAAGIEAYNLLQLRKLYTPTEAMKRTIDEHVAKFTQSFVSTDREKLSNILKEGLESGKSIPQIEQDIRSVFGQYKKSQASTISRTEILRASNAGQLDAYKESGVVEGKQWLTSPSPDECEEYNGKIVWDLDAGFYSSENDFADGDPPLHPNCRCILLPVLAETKGADQEITAMRQYVAELEKMLGIDG